MMGKCNNAFLPLLPLFLHISGFFAAPSGHGEEAFVGVNIGTQISDMPSPTDVVALLKAQQIRHVRLFNADPAMLKALANTGISVVVTIPNNLIIGIGESNATAAKWVSQNVLTHLPSTRITAIAVGSNILVTLPNAARVLVNAMNFTHSALVGAGLDSQIKVSTPLSSDVILESFPPSRAHFNSSWLGVMNPLLKFLDSTGSYLMLNVYPYYAYVSSNGTIALDYALFRPLPRNKDAIDSSTFLHYTNVFDAMVDAAYFAMSNLSYPNIPVVVTESGWPSKGELSEPDATPDNANTYNSNLISRVLNGTGTPKRPGVAVSTYIHELYNEDKNPGLASQQNWGLFNRIGVAVYTLHLKGSVAMFQNDTKIPTFCVAKQSADTALVQSGLDWACGPGKVNCSLLTTGQPCYDPNDQTRLSSHASYAFDAYYHSQGMTDTECDFRGAATLTTTDPSHGSCIYPGSVGRNGSFTNGTSPVPSTNSTDSGCGSRYLHDSNALIISSLIACFAFWL